MSALTEVEKCRGKGGVGHVGQLYALQHVFNMSALIEVDECTGKGRVGHVGQLGTA